MQLIGKDSYQMYNEVSDSTHQKHDRCVIDVFISAVRYMEGGPLKIGGSLLKNVTFNGIAINVCLIRHTERISLVFS